MPITTIAKKIKLSLNGVKKRINKLEKEGVIKGYSCELSFGILGEETGLARINVSSAIERVQEVVDIIGNHELIFTVGVGIGNKIIAVFTYKTSSEVVELENWLKSISNVDTVEIFLLLSRPIKDKSRIAPADYLPMDVGEAAWKDEIIQNITYDNSGDFFQGDVDTLQGNGKLAEVDTYLAPIRMATVIWAKGVSWNVSQVAQAALPLAFQEYGTERGRQLGLATQIPSLVQTGAQLENIQRQRQTAPAQALQQYAGFVSPIATGLPTTIGSSQVQANPFSTALGGAMVGGQFGGGAGALIGGGLGLLGGLL